MAADPISGTWTSGRDYVRLSWDGHESLTGIITVRGPRNIATIRSGSFDPATGAMRIAGDAVNPDNGQPVPFEIDGTLSGSTISVRFRFGDDSGDGTLTKVSPWGMLASLFRSIFAPKVRPPGLPPYVPGPLNREQMAALRRTRPQNEAALRERGETLDSLVFREPSEADINALAQLHVITWAATYPDVYSPPTFAIRSWQWRDAFRRRDPDKWFAIVIENAGGRLVGFLKGVRGGDNNDNGDVNKIYLLDEYQRMGLGARMLGRACRRFMQMGCRTMTVHAESNNPSCGFYEATGGVTIVDPKTGRPAHGSYIWRDLPALSARCPD